MLPLNSNYEKPGLGDSKKSDLKGKAAELGELSVGVLFFVTVVAALNSGLEVANPLAQSFRQSGQFLPAKDQQDHDNDNDPFQGEIVLNVYERCALSYSKRIQCRKTAESMWMARPRTTSGAIAAAALALLTRNPALKTSAAITIHQISKTEK